MTKELSLKNLEIETGVKKFKQKEIKRVYFMNELPFALFHLLLIFTSIFYGYYLIAIPSSLILTGVSITFISKYFSPIQRRDYLAWKQWVIQDLKDKGCAKKLVSNYLEAINKHIPEERPLISEEELRTLEEEVREKTEFLEESIKDKINYLENYEEN